ncbi:speckle-type POZ protein-like [Phymastichus coffea]|uniref:speckle-type POZ protein-like n=1 Tax=Phymastichus coffea TaxID=108790 RepID=UPI00273AACF4|nr:speckle-type POZ protein-like [Phymastichus coffea]
MTDDAAAAATVAPIVNVQTPRHFRAPPFTESNVKLWFRLMEVDIKKTKMAIKSPAFRSRFMKFFCIKRLTISPYSSNWGVTMINTKVISYSWTISNYSLNDLKQGESFKSPIFSGDGGDEYLWQLRWFPKGRAFQDYYVNNKKTYARSATQKFSETELGWFDFIRQSDLRNNGKNLLPDDTLTIFIEITVQEGTNNLSGNCRFSDTVLFDDYFTKFLENNFLSDVQLNVGGQVIQAHHVVLAAHIDVMLMRQIVRLMYTGKIDIPDAMAKELLKLSDQFGIEKLKLICQETLCKSMKPINATDILVLATLHNATNLEKEALNYKAAHAGSVVNTPGFITFEKSYPNPFYLIFRTLNYPLLTLTCKESGAMNGEQKVQTLITRFESILFSKSVLERMSEYRSL